MALLGMVVRCRGSKHDPKVDSWWYERVLHNLLLRHQVYKALKELEKVGVRLAVSRCYDHLPQIRIEKDEKHLYDWEVAFDMFGPEPLWETIDLW